MVTPSAEPSRDVQSRRRTQSVMERGQLIRIGGTVFNANDGRAWRWVHVVLGARKAEV